MGKMRVTSELLKKGYEANIKFITAKSVKVIIIGDNEKSISVEVKTSRNQKKFVTNYYPKYTDSNSERPEIWVFYLPDKNANSDGDRFFILTHEEVGEMQLKVNKGTKTEKGKGVDNIPLSFLENEKSLCEARWHLFSEILYSI
jgi:hypothetical protein